MEIDGHDLLLRSRRLRRAISTEGAVLRRDWRTWTLGIAEVVGRDGQKVYVNLHWYRPAK